MLKIHTFYSCFCLSGDFLVAKGDLKVEQTRMQMARGFPIYFLFLGSRNACFFFVIPFPGKHRRQRNLYGFWPSGAAPFSIRFFNDFLQISKIRVRGYTENIEYSWGFILILVSGLGAGPAIGGIRWRFFFCINCRKH